MHVRSETPVAQEGIQKNNNESWRDKEVNLKSSATICCPGGAVCNHYFMWTVIPNDANLLHKFDDSLQCFPVVLS